MPLNSIFRSGGRRRHPRSKSDTFQAHSFRRSKASSRRGIRVLLREWPLSSTVAPLGAHWIGNAPRCPYCTLQFGSPEHVCCSNVVSQEFMVPWRPASVAASQDASRDPPLPLAWLFAFACSSASRAAASPALPILRVRLSSRQSRSAIADKALRGAGEDWGLGLRSPVSLGSMGSWS